MDPTLPRTKALRDKGFIRCLRRLVSTPGVCEWFKRPDGLEMFKFSNKDLVSMSMPIAGFKTNKLTSLVRQMNSYSFTYTPHRRIDVDAKLQSYGSSQPGIGGYWHHILGAFCEDSARDCEISKTHKQVSRRTQLAPVSESTVQVCAGLGNTTKLGRRLFSDSDDDESDEGAEDLETDNARTGGFIELSGVNSSQQGLIYKDLSGAQRPQSSPDLLAQSLLGVFSLTPQVVRVRIKLNGKSVVAGNTGLSASLPSISGWSKPWEHDSPQSVLQLDSTLGSWQTTESDDDSVEACDSADGEIASSSSSSSSRSEESEESVTLNKLNSGSVIRDSGLKGEATNYFCDENRKALQGKGRWNENRNIDESNQTYAISNSPLSARQIAINEASWEESLDFIVENIDSAGTTGTPRPDWWPRTLSSQHNQGIGLNWYGEDAGTDSTVGAAETLRGNEGSPASSTQEQFSLFQNLEFRFAD